MSRQDRITQAIKKEVSLILQNEIHDPRLGFVTITDVETSADLRYAKIFFSVLGADEDYKKTAQALNSALGFIRHLIAERVQLKFAPEIVFKEDRSGEHSIKIEKILDEINELKKSNRVHKKE